MVIAGFVLGYGMRLHVQDTIETGTALLDTGITDLEIAVINGQVHFYASTGRNCGLVHYSVDDAGHVQTETTVIFPPVTANALRAKPRFFPPVTSITTNPALATIC